LADCRAKRLAKGRYLSKKKACYGKTISMCISEEKAPARPSRNMAWEVTRWSQREYRCFAEGGFGSVPERGEIGTSRPRKSLRVEESEFIFGERRNSFNPEISATVEEGRKKKNSRDRL